MSTETLLICPHCNQPNFTKRGLAGHWCKALGSRRLSIADREAAEAAATSPSPMPKQSLTLVQPATVIDVEPAAALDPWAKARRYVEAATLFQRASLASQILAGVELTALRKTFPETRGGNQKQKPHGAAFAPLTWADAVKKHLGISPDTASRWMEMGKAAKKRLSNGDLDLGAILEKNPGSLTPAEQELLKKAVHKISDGRTQLEFMLECGVTKAPQGSAAKGGDTRAAAAANAAEPAEPNPDLPEAQGWDLQAHSLNNILLSGIQQGWWRECTEAKLKELHGNLLDLTSQVSDALKGRAGK